MEVFEDFRGLKVDILYFLLVFLVLGIALGVSGVNILKQNKKAGVLCILLGSLLSISAVFLMFVNLIFGYNS